MAYLVPTIHPAAALRSGQQITDVIAADLGKAHRISQTGPELVEHIVWPLPGNPEGIVPSWEKALGWLRYWRATGARLGVDVETSALDYFNCKLYSIALGDAESHVGVAFTLCDFHTLPLQFEQALVNELRLILVDPMIEKVFHNAPFDMAVLHRKNLPVCGPILDTQGMHHLVQPDIQHNLGSVGQTYLDCGPWKYDHSSGKMANTNDPVELLIYNARDALYTVMLVEPLKRAIEQRGMSSTLISWQSAYAQLATDMEIAGLPVNIEKRRQMALTMREKKGAALYKMREFLSWPDFNPMADAHRREALFGDKYAQSPWNLGLTATKHTKKLGLPSTSFKSVIDNLEHPFVRAMADYVETQQVYATQYRDGTLKDEKGAWEEPGKYQRFLYEDGRIHPRWKSNTLNSVRYASEPNVQNQRVFDREFFEAPPGRCFIASDLDQLELRIAACRAGVGELLAEMARPDGDPHTLAARHVFGAEFDAREPKARKMLRDMTKNTVYASLYLAGIITVWRTIRERKQLDPALRAAMTLPVVRHIHKSYFMRYMEFPRWHEADLRFINTHGYLEIPPFGRRRYCPVLPAPATEFSNWKVQCLGAEIATSNMVYIQDELRRRFKNAHIIKHGHDEVLIEADEKDAEAISEIVKRLFGSTVLEGPAGPVTLTAGLNIGKSMKDVK